MNMIRMLDSSIDIYNTLKQFTNTDTAKQKIIQMTAVFIITNAVYDASRRRLIQSTISTIGAAVLWMNQEAFLHKALSENVIDLNKIIEKKNEQIEKTETQIEKMETQIANIEKVHEGGKKFLDLQVAELERITEERGRLTEERNAFTEERNKLEIQVRELEKIKKDIATHIQHLKQIQKTFGTSMHSSEEYIKI